MANGNPSSKLIVPFMGGFYGAASGWGYPIMRFFVGLFLVPHGAQKLFGWFGGSAQGTAAFFTKVGLEPALSLVYLVGAIEFFGGILIAIGLLTRPAAAVACIMLLVAVFSVHMGNGFFWTKSGYEYPMLWAILMFAIFLRGGGERSLDSAIGREF